MFNFFNKLISGGFFIHSEPSGHYPLRFSSDPIYRGPIGHPIWCKIILCSNRPHPSPSESMLSNERDLLYKKAFMPEQMRLVQRGIKNYARGSLLDCSMLVNSGNYRVEYTIGPWKAYSLPVEQLLPFYHGKFFFLQNPEKVLGLAGILDNSVKGRIKSIGLEELIKYSYWKDLRFVFMLSAMIGFSLYWFTAPELLKLNPIAITTPDYTLLIRAIRDTFENTLCYVHQLPSPCHCGEPINKTVQDLFKEPIIQYDPLDLFESYSTRKAICSYLASIVLIIALSESVSDLGVLVEHVKW